MENAYFRWLVGLLGDDYFEQNYSKLLIAMFYKEFKWTIEYDENRAKDGLGLRRIFVKETGIMPKNGQFWPFSGCSVLEMLISMAKKCEDELIYNPDKGDQTSHIFWVMIENLGLDIYDDYGFYEDEVNDILDVFIDRKYASDGSGNVFQLRRTDPRNLDLWLQMNLYLRDHFYEYWEV